MYYLCLLRKCSSCQILLTFIELMFLVLLNFVKKDYLFGRFWASVIIQLVKNMPSIQETLVGKICWRRDRLPTPGFLGISCESAGKESPAMWETWVWSLVGQISWRRERLPTPVFLGFPCGSACKEFPAVWKTWIWSLGWEDPLEKRKATHFSILAKRIPWILLKYNTDREKVAYAKCRAWWIFT